MLRVARRQNPLVEQAHLPEHLPEIDSEARGQILDAHAGDDVLFAAEHAAHHLGDVRGVVTTRVLVGTVGDDDGDSTRGHTASLKLGHLGHHCREGDGRLVVQRGAADRIVVFLVEQLRAVEGDVGVEHPVVSPVVVQVATGDEYRIGLLGVLERGDDAVAALAHHLGVTGEADGSAVVDQHGDEHHLGRRDVIERDRPEAGLDGRSERVRRELHGAYRCIFETGVSDELGQFC